MSKSNAERQKAWREKNKGLIQVRVHVKTQEQADEIKAIARKMREGK